MVCFRQAHCPAGIQRWALFYDSFLVHANMKREDASVVLLRHLVDREEPHSSGSFTLWLEENRCPKQFTVSWVQEGPYRLCSVLPSASADESCVSSDAPTVEKVRAPQRVDAMGGYRIVQVLCEGVICVVERLSQDRDCCDKGVCESFLDLKRLRQRRIICRHSGCLSTRRTTPRFNRCRRTPGRYPLSKRPCDVF